MMNLVRRLNLSGIIAIILSAILLWQTMTTPEKLTLKDQDQPQRAALTVAVVRPVMTLIPLTLSANGSIAAWQEAFISSELGGIRLAEILAEVGDRVRKGQVLAVFDQERVAMDLANSEALLLEANAMLEEARENARRVRQIINEGALSQLQAGQYLTSEKTAEARMRSAKAQVEIQKQRMRHTKVIANDDGIIAKRLATLGKVTQDGEELFRLIRQERLEWRAEVIASEIPRLQIGAKVDVRVPDIGTTQGVVRMVGPGLDPESRFGLVYVDLPGAATRGFKPGMFAEGRVRFGQSSALTLPRTAITLRDGFSYAFKVIEGPGGKAHVEEIKLQLGRTEGDLIEVLEGIHPDDPLVLQGGAFLADGDLVSIVP